MLVLVTILMSPWLLAFKSWHLVSLVSEACPLHSVNDSSLVNSLSCYQPLSKEESHHCLIVVMFVPVASANSSRSLGNFYVLLVFSWNIIIGKFFRPCVYTQHGHFPKDFIPPSTFLHANPFLHFSPEHCHFLSVGLCLMHALGAVLVVNLHDLGFLPECYIMYVGRMLLSQ